MAVMAQVSNRGEGLTDEEFLPEKPAKPLPSDCCGTG